MSERLDFATTLNRLNGMPPMSDCYNYGMTYGCDTECPVLQAGKCDIQGDENAELYKQCLEETE